MNYYNPIESALFPLADGIPNRVGILRGAGNAIVPQAAAEIIKAISGGEQPCDFCGMLYNRELLGMYGCPDCYGEGLDCDD